MKLFRAAVIFFAIIVGVVLYFYQDFKNTRDASQFYAEKGNIQTRPEQTSFPEFLEKLNISASQTRYINDLKSAHYQPGKLGEELSENFDFAGLITEPVIDKILAQKATEPVKLIIAPQKYFQNSLAISQKGRRFSQILALNALLEADRQQPQKATRLFEAALAFFPEAYRFTEGMFFGVYTRIQVLLDINFLCRSINQACYLGEFDEYSVSILLERLKNIEEKFPPFKDVLLQYRSLPGDFTKLFTNWSSEKEKKHHLETQKILLTMVPDAEAFFDKNYAKFLEIADLEINAGQKLGAEFAQKQKELLQNFKDRSSPANLFRNPFGYRRYFAEHLACIDAPPFQDIHRIVWKTRQQLEGTRTILAIEAFTSRNAKPPENLEELNMFFNQNFGRDLYSGKQLDYASSPLALRSCGPDGSFGNEDDIAIFPETSAPSSN